MKETYLNYEQSICGARIFLNTLGLTLENSNNIDNNSMLCIFNDDIEVGHLYFDRNKVMINAKCDNDVLSAYYDIPKISGFIDVESNNAVFGEWRNDIKFQIQREDKSKISGNYLLNVSVDSEFGVNVLCHPVLICEFESGNVTIKMQRDGASFKANIAKEDYHERIEIRPWDNLNGYFLHDIIKGEHDENAHYPYRRYCGVFSAGTSNDVKDKLHIFLNETEYEGTLSLLNEFPLREINSKDEFLQKCSAMKIIDTKMYDRINDLRDALKIGKVSLIDSLVSICFDSYSDEMIKGMLGIDRSKMNYQNEADNLREAYFDVMNKNAFSLKKSI